MKRRVPILMYSLFLLKTGMAFSQEIKFNRVLDASHNQLSMITGIAQDQLGYIWFSTFSNGLFQYDGINLKRYGSDSLDANSLVSNNTSTLAIDSSGSIWIGTMGLGLDRFDPATKKFTHFKNDIKDVGALTNDSISTLYVDHLNNVWIGTRNGLDLFDNKTEKFTHFKHDQKNSSSISNNQVFCIYEDRQHMIWIGCGLPWKGDDIESEKGGLNKLDRKTGKFTRYMHIPGDANSIANNKVTAIFEDSKGDFWIGTSGDGLHIMDRVSGRFVTYAYDAAHPEKLSRPPLLKNIGPVNFITFITEDLSGSIWIGSFAEGLNRYNPSTKRVTHFGKIIQLGKLIQDDLRSGFDEPYSNTPFRAITSKDGLFWVGTYDGNLYNVNLHKSDIEYYEIKSGANSFYEQDSILWIATDEGLFKRNRHTGVDEKFIYQPTNPNSPAAGTANVLRADNKGNLWLATNGGGLNKLNLATNKFTRYTHDEKNGMSPGGENIYCLHIDKNQDLWIGMTGKGVDKMNTATGSFTHYRHIAGDAGSLVSDNPNCFAEDEKQNIWIGTQNGLDKLNRVTDRFDHYMTSQEILSVLVDSKGDVWAGTTKGLYRFDKGRIKFDNYKIQGSSYDLKPILNILEDPKKNLWVGTNDALLRINPARDNIKIYGKRYGIHNNQFYLGDNYIAPDGEVFVGDQNGYYSFFPDRLADLNGPLINISSFILVNRVQAPSATGPLLKAIWETEKIRLNHKQNTFAFDFTAIDYKYSEDLEYSFKLENYDDEWHVSGKDHKAYFFNVPPGQYIFHAKATNSEGVYNEKVIIIDIAPPWWRTWWAYTCFALLFIGMVWTFIYYRSRKLKLENKLLEEKISKRTDQLKRSLENLKATQTQLIQSEKMASLGELTAGIAHEIQNPLNFVNNFSELNQELIDELKTELAAGNQQQAIDLANDISENEEKINHHGKRADAIVKGMLQHSRSSSGVKEPTDINALADEYLRLAYHGLRAKDKSFNATIETDFDESIGKINVIPQDIGRVILNLITNAFYSVTEKKKQQSDHYEPTVRVSTKKSANTVEIRVKDNGGGIPQKVMDKIFQPFFTTKPTGQGTGLGLSLSYDIVKAHGGELIVESSQRTDSDTAKKESGHEGAEFIIKLSLI